MCAEGAARVRVTLGGAVRCLSAGIVVEAPFASPFHRVIVDGRQQPATEAQRVTVRSTAREVVFDYKSHQGAPPTT
jgi:hypothetical protein